MRARFEMRTIIMDEIPDPWLAESLTDVLLRLGISMPILSSAIKIFKRVSEIKKIIINEMNGSSSLRQGNKQEYKPKSITKFKEIMKDRFAIMVGCLTVTYKYRKDIPLTNEAWATATKIDSKLLNQIEKEILAMLDYKIEVDKIKVEYDKASKKEQSLARKRFNKIFCF